MTLDYVPEWGNWEVVRTDADMNRDRGVVDAWKANCEIGKLWASVTDGVQVHLRLLPGGGQGRLPVPGVPNITPRSAICLSRSARSSG